MFKIIMAGFRILFLKIENFERYSIRNYNCSSLLKAIFKNQNVLGKASTEI